jgi:hypothetical protein
MQRPDISSQLRKEGVLPCVDVPFAQKQQLASNPHSDRELIPRARVNLGSVGSGAHVEVRRDLGWFVAGAADRAVASSPDEPNALVFPSRVNAGGYLSVDEYR